VDQIRAIWHLRYRSPPRRVDEGAFVVPPHFATALLTTAASAPDHGGEPSEPTEPTTGRSSPRSGGSSRVPGRRLPSLGGSLDSRSTRYSAPSSLSRDYTGTGAVPAQGVHGRPRAPPNDDSEDVPHRRPRRKARAGHCAVGGTRATVGRCPDLPVDAHPVCDPARDGRAVESAGVEPQHGVGRESVGQLQGDTGAPGFALPRRKVAQT
jgi:hypothetical protein